VNINFEIRCDLLVEDLVGVGFEICSDTLVEDVGPSRYSGMFDLRLKILLHVYN